MREHKFRAWNSTLKEMNNVMSIHWHNGVVVRIIMSKLGVEDILSEGWFDIKGEGLKKVKLIEWTGLKDKNGKEIYEGDLIKLETPTMPFSNGLVQEVKFEDFSWYLCGGIRHSLSVPNSVKLEVIGNIYENPDLLK